MVLNKKEFHTIEIKYKKYLDMSNGLAIFLLFFLIRYY
jgi:hypothetical protein